MPKKKQQAQAQQPTTIQITLSDEQVSAIADMALARLIERINAIAAQATTEEVQEEETPEVEVSA